MKLVCGLLLVLSASAQSPLYVTSSIGNAADARVSSLAPGAIATLYGKNLANTTRALTTDDLVAGTLPTLLPGTGLRLFVGGLATQLFYVSPTQINFLVPPVLVPGNTTVRVALDGRSGPVVPIQLAAASPALFRLDPDYALAIRPDGVLIDRQRPAHPGDVIILYANGLGYTKPPFLDGQIADRPAPLERPGDFRVTLNGVALTRESILYAGIAPGFAGLYQINLVLPGKLGADPEIRIFLGSLASPAGVRLPVLPD